MPSRALSHCAAFTKPRAESVAGRNQSKLGAVNECWLAMVSQKPLCCEGRSKCCALQPLECSIPRLDMLPATGKTKWNLHQAGLAPYQPKMPWSKYLFALIRGHLRPLCAPLAVHGDLCKKVTAVNFTLNKGWGKKRGKSKKRKEERKKKEDRKMNFLVISLQRSVSKW